MTSKTLKTVIILTLALALAWGLLLKDILADIETLSYDWRAKIATEKHGLSRHDPDIILLAADDASVNMLESHPKLNPGRWPWPRALWGDIVNYINKGNPKTVVFDLKFEGETGNGDRYFAETIKNKNIVVATALSQPKTSKSVRKTVKLLDKELQKHGKHLDNQKNEHIDAYIASVYSLIYKSNPLNSRLVLAPDQNYYHGLTYDNKKARKFLDNITFYGKSSIYADLLDNAKALGVINLKNSENVVFRHHVPLYRLVTTDSINYIPSLPLAAVMSILSKDENPPFVVKKDKIVIGKRVIPLDKEGRLLLNWHGEGGTYETIPIARVILGEIPPEHFRDKIIVIGQTSAGTDIHPTPVSSVYPGPEIIATAIDNLLNDADTTNPQRRKFVKKAPFWLNTLLTLLFCYVIAVRIRLFPVMILFYIALAVFVFVLPQTRIWLNMTYPLIFMILTGISAYAYRSYQENRERKQVESLFGRFVSPQILEKLLSDRESISRQSQRKVMTVLFSDIRGFTALSEDTPADEVITTLNEYITEMVEVILSYNGTLDKYIGDAIMAFYNDPVEMDDHALKAVLTARAMREKLVELNEKWQVQGKPPLSIGIGINTGEMIVGHMGSPRLVDYTVVGDNVNLASRIESLTKDYGVNILIGETTYNAVKDSVDARYVDEVAIKGRKGTVKIYEVK